jgi:hypothetical protein
MPAASENSPHEANCIRKTNSFRLITNLFRLNGKDSEGTKMNSNAPVTLKELTVLRLDDMHLVVGPDSEPDLDLLEIEEAKKHFEDHPDAEAFWAGRLLADRKSTRIAA